ncbi:MAG: hypothetical protein L6Q38_18460, partial [Nitrospira sp.]|nr:hypothetical protein [Nitrospira sp.]
RGSDLDVDVRSTAVDGDLQDFMKEFHVEEDTGAVPASERDGGGSAGSAQMRQGERIQAALRLRRDPKEKEGHLIAFVPVAFTRHHHTTAGHPGLFDRGLDGKVHLGPRRNGLRRKELDAVLAYRDCLSGKTDGG